MNGTLSMACTVGGLHQHKWREQGDTPLPKDIVKVSNALYWTYVYS